jgi:starvation-inducible outer membrane lipoprotein
MKTTLALLVFASFALTGCATQPETTQAQALDTPSKMMKAEYDAPITASRLPSSKVQ